MYPYINYRHRLTYMLCSGYGCGACSGRSGREPGWHECIIYLLVGSQISDELGQKVFFDSFIIEMVIDTTISY